MTAPILRFVDRPYTSPCRLCPNAIPLDQTVSLADEQRNTVCDECAQRIDPAKHAALAVLRAVDAGWWEHGRALETAAVAEANAWLAHVAAGVAVLAEFYGAAGDPTDKWPAPQTSSS